MGMAASQARLLSITSRMADNELRAQIANNAKMRLASDSSRISADYVSALNNATMMISNYNEAGESQFSKLTFNRLTQYSPFNTQYGLGNTYGQLLVSENEAKIFEAAGGSLATYLEKHGLKYNTTYFTPESFDGKTTIEFQDEYGKSLGNFTLEELKTMYFGGQTADGINHKGFADNEDVYDMFQRQISNFSVAYNRCQNDTEIVELIEGDLKTEVNKFSKINGQSRYDWYRDVASGNFDLGSMSTTDLRLHLRDAIKLISDISVDGDNISPEAYVKGATSNYYNKLAETYLNEDGSLKNLEDLGYKTESGLNISGTAYYYYGNKDSMYGEYMETVGHYASDSGNKFGKDSGNKVSINVNTDGVWHGEAGSIGNGDKTINDNNTFLIKVTSDAIDPNKMDWPSYRGYGALPPGYIALTKNGNNIYFLYGQNNSDDHCNTYADLGTEYGTFVDDYAGKNGIYEVDLYNQNNGLTVEYDDTLVYDLSNSYNGLNRDANGMLISDMRVSTSNETDYVEDYNTKLEDNSNSYEDYLKAAKKAEADAQAAYDANQTDENKNALDKATAYRKQIEAMGKTSNKTTSPLQLGFQFNNTFIFRSNNKNGDEYTEYHNFLWNGTYLVVDPNGLSVSKTGDNVTTNTITEAKVYGFKGDKLIQMDVMNEWQIYASLLKNVCEDAFGRSEYTTPDGKKEPASIGNFHYTVNILEYIEEAAAKGNENAKAAVDIKANILNKFGIDMRNIKTTDFTYIGDYVDQLKGKGEVQQSVYDNYILNCLFDIYGEPNVTWIDENNPTGDAEAKVQWYTNLFERMSKGYAVLEDGLASSNEWMEYALESGIVAVEQVDKSNHWNGTLYSNVASITEVTDEAAVAKAEAEYKKSMNEVENKDKRLDIELKNIDTEHNALQTEYESVKSVISKNVERSFKMYNA